MLQAFLKRNLEPSIHLQTVCSHSIEISHTILREKKVSLTPLYTATDIGNKAIYASCIASLCNIWKKL